MRIAILFTVAAAAAGGNGENLSAKLSSGKESLDNGVLRLVFQFENKSETKRESLAFCRKVVAYDDLGNSYRVLRIHDGATGGKVPEFVDNGKPQLIFVDLNSLHSEAAILTVEFGAAKKGEGRIKVSIRKSDIQSLK